MTRFLVMTLLVSITSTVAAAERAWPQWRGPSRDATVSRDAVSWNKDFKALKQSWRVELGPSYSGPIVSDFAVFTTETVNEEKEVVRAFDRKTGKQLWETEWLGAMEVPFFAKANGDWIRSTPAFDGDTLYVGGIRDVLVAVNAKTGDIRWRIDFVEEYGTPVPGFGLVCSPLVTDDALYIQAADSFVKVDKKTGKVTWRKLIQSAGMMSSAFSSPIMTSLHGVRQLVVQTRQKLAGVNPETGDIYWEQPVPSFRGMNILTPVIYNNGILTSTHRRQTYFYQIGKKGDEWSVDLKWTNKGQGYMSSPVVVGQHAYLHLGNGRLSSLNLETGEESWRSESFGKYWSMVTDGQHILALDERGELLLIQPDPTEFKLVDRTKVSDQDTWAHIAPVGNQIFVRELHALTAWTWN